MFGIGPTIHVETVLQYDAPEINDKNIVTSQVIRIFSKISLSFQLETSRRTLLTLHQNCIHHRKNS